MSIMKENIVPLQINIFARRFRHDWQGSCGRVTRQE